MAHVRMALIIGGGVADPVAVVALHKAGIAAAVYEAYADSAKGVGAFLGLGHNGSESMPERWA